MDGVTPQSEVKIKLLIHSLIILVVSLQSQSLR
jgi:hypothetical protein